MNPVDTFKAYFEAFEETYLDDNWDRIAPYFAPDMIYNNAEGETLESCAVITTEASQQIVNIHHRMPVILNPGVYDAWLDRSLQDVDRLASVLTDGHITNLTHFPVSKQVNTARVNELSNIAPLKQMKFDF